MSWGGPMKLRRSDVEGFSRTGFDETNAAIGVTTGTKRNQTYYFSASSVIQYAVLFPTNVYNRYNFLSAAFDR